MVLQWSVEPESGDKIRWSNHEVGSFEVTNIMFWDDFKSTNLQWKIELYLTSSIRLDSIL